MCTDTEEPIELKIFNLLEDISDRLTNLEAVKNEFVSKKDFCKYFEISLGRFYNLNSAGLLKSKGKKYSIKAYENYLEKKKKEKLLVKRVAKSIKTA